MKKIILLILITLTLIGCSGVDKKEKRLVFKEDMIQITIDSVEKIKFKEGSEITFKLWGYDTRVADAKATLLKEYTYSLSKLPVTYGLDHQKEWDVRITPGESGEYGYYVTLEGTDKNGNIYIVDYDAIDSNYFGTRKLNKKELSGKIFIKKSK